MKVIRTFHPIGQGAFYSEQFINDNNTPIGTIVYDCGSNNLTCLKKIIPGCFISRDIDILFISHFDADHINGISTLKKYYNIKRVIMPLIHVPDKILLKIYYAATCNNKSELKHGLKIIDDPKAFFDSEHTKITFVTPIENAENNELGQEVNSNELSETIYSHTPITYQRDNLTWTYIPLHYKKNERIKAFQKALHDQNILIDNWDDALFDAPELIKKIQEIYKKLKGGTNGNSLILYSGTNTKVDSFINYFSAPFPYYYGRFIHRCLVEKSGCIYLGDMDLNYEDVLSDIKSSLARYNNTIGLIQVPHHGAKESYNVNLLSYFPDNQYYVLSYGIRNRYGHPSHMVICSIISNFKYLVLVNEDVRSMCTQIIEV